MNGDRFCDRESREIAVEERAVLVAHAHEADSVRARPRVLGERDPVDPQDPLRARKLKLERHVGVRQEDMLDDS